MEFSKQFIEIMNALADKVGIIIDWGSKNVVPYIQDLGSRLVNYEIATSATWIVIMILITITLYILANKFEDEALLIFAIVSTLATVVVVGVQVFDIIQALTIPEKTIYDMMSMYIK